MYQGTDLRSTLIEFQLIYRILSFLSDNGAVGTVSIVPRASNYGLSLVRLSESRCFTLQNRHNIAGYARVC